MKLTRTSPLTGKQNTLDLPITPEDYNRWKNGGFLIQQVFPDLTDDQREFILTGLLPGEFEEFVGPEDLLDDDMPKKGDSFDEEAF